MRLRTVLRRTSKAALTGTVAVMALTAAAPSASASSINVGDYLSVGDVAVSGCVPVYAGVGSTKVEVCSVPTVENPDPSDPGYAVGNAGYLKVCTPVCKTYSLAVRGSGAEVNDEDAQGTITPEAPLVGPKVCVGGTCYSTAVPRYEIRLFEGSPTVTLYAAGIPVPADVPAICISMAGTGCGPNPLLDAANDVIARLVVTA